MTIDRRHSSIATQNAIDYLVSAMVIGLTAILFTLMANHYAHSSPGVPTATEMSSLLEEYSCEDFGKDYQEILTETSGKQFDLPAAL